MIRFGVIVSVVVAAVVLLIGGAVAGELALVYGSIGLAALALVLLIIGVAVWRDQVFASSGRQGERASRQDDRSLAAVGAVGQAGRPVGGAGLAEDRRERPAPAPGASPTPGPGPGGDPRDFAAPIGARPERAAPADRYERSGEPRPAEQVRHGADPVGAAGREAAHRQRYGREAGAAERPDREPATDRPGREAPPGERSAREAAADRSAREQAPARRSDRVERYPIVGPEPFEPAEDPTRLAHRLDSLADLGRPYDPEAAGSAPSQQGRLAGQRLPARAGTDPPAGRSDERRSARDPLSPVSPPSAAPPVLGTSRPTGPERSSGAGVDAPAPAAAAPPSPVPAAAAPAAAVPASPAPVTAAPPVTAPPAASLAAAAPTRTVFARTPPATAEAVPALGSAGPVGPAESGRDRPDAANTRTATPGDAGAAPADPIAARTTTRDGGTDTAPGVSPDDMVSVVPGIARYHKADCILIRFLSEDDLELMARRDAEATGCAPCRACRPERPSAAG
jgi:hypothetical protein